MGHRVALIALATAIFCAALGCGGSRGPSPSGGHTYVFVPLAAGKGFYVTLVSPAAVPTNALRNKGDKVVAQAKGPQDCSITKRIQGGQGKAAYLNGKTVTVKVNGSNPVTQGLCEELTKGRTFKPSIIRWG
jgi:hypothetical protein